MKNIILKILAALPALLLSSCVYEDLYPCPEGISLRFVYNYNMEYADAFSSRVDCLTLYVYDGNGKHVGTYTETGDVLRNEDYRMVIDLPEGSYKFVAYGGLACERHSFSVTPAPADDFSMEDVEVVMEHDNHTSDVQLHDLFWGMTDADVAYEEYSDAVIYMMKDTHDIRVILQQSDTGAEPLSIEDFDISITGMNNYHFLWDNSVSSPCRESWPTAGQNSSSTATSSRRRWWIYRLSSTCSFSRARSMRTWTARNISTGKDAGTSSSCSTTTPGMTWT